MPLKDWEEGEVMELKKEVIIRLDLSEAHEVLRIEMDGDAREALGFIKDNLAKKIKDALQPR